MTLRCPMMTLETAARASCLRACGSPGRNRNAASHLWAAFLLDRAHMMTPERLELMFSGFCAVSGSPVRPSDYTRYRLTLPLVAGGNRSGYMYYCCAPPTPPPTAACSC